jgi:hypothetical protein
MHARCADGTGACARRDAGVPLEEPLRVDLQTGEVHSEEKKVFRFSVRFRKPEIRGFE